MGRTKKVGIVGRFGARGGSSLRKARAKIEEEAKSIYECPQCLRRAVKKFSVGVWKCSRCGFTFAGGAYKPSTKLGETVKKERDRLLKH
ncbi:50S ribosomal protein L37ae [Candidatus Hecatella orcuttiae]|jgi:large subunit ribosomal protein L37Ae|uniref:50S ribosomal protein L37ae n=1 Tax=Candidatus Hecatella orcuttiae TaxID=1935119 RepID=UPI0028682FE0|nr:50S ribosomal protein L37ae [Candidatus Hecatella orcuttiae]